MKVEEIIRREVEEIAKLNPEREKEMIREIVKKVVELIASKNGRLPYKQHFLADLGRERESIRSVFTTSRSLVFYHRNLAVWEVSYNELNPTFSRSEEYITHPPLIVKYICRYVDNYEKLTKFLEELVKNLQSLSKYYKSRLGKVIPRLEAALKALSE